MTATTLRPGTARRPGRARRGSLARHSAYLAVRSLKALWRQPAFAVATLVQPIIWLLLFGQLFQRGRGHPRVRRGQRLLPGVPHARASS